MQENLIKYECRQIDAFHFRFEKYLPFQCNECSMDINPCRQTVRSDCQFGFAGCSLLASHI